MLNEAGSGLISVRYIILIQNYEIHCLVPDLPAPQAVLPYLEEMQANRWYSNFGPVVGRFEGAMAKFLKLDDMVSPMFVQTFSSATAGLEIALRALNLPAHAKVLVPALTFPATALAAVNAGLTPVLADVNDCDWMLSADVARQIHANTPLAAVMPVAAFGSPIDIGQWEKFQDDTGVPVILDAAAALGQQEISPKLIHVFSMHATKPFGVGEGGLLVAPDEAFVAQAKSLSNFGFLGAGGVVRQVGTNAKMGEYYAAVGMAQIDRWTEVLGRRKEAAHHYFAGLQGLKNAIKYQKGFEELVPAVFPVYIQAGAQKVIDRLEAEGIQTRRWYLPPLYEHPALTHLEKVSVQGDGILPVCEDLKTKLVGLPFHGFLSEADINKICKIVAEETL